MEFASNVFTAWTIYLQVLYIYRMRIYLISQCPFKCLKQHIRPLHSYLFGAPYVTERWLCIVSSDLAFVTYTYLHTNIYI